MNYQEIGLGQFIIIITMTMVIGVFFIAELSNYKKKKKSYFKFIIITLGLLGTFIGILISIGGIEDFDTISDLKENINTLFGGLRFAFIPSIIGLILFIFLVVMEILMQRNNIEQQQTQPTSLQFSSTDTIQQLINYLEQSNISQREQTSILTQELKSILSQFSSTDTVQRLMDYLEQSNILQKEQREQTSVLTQELKSILSQFSSTNTIQRLVNYLEQITTLQKEQKEQTNTAIQQPLPRFSSTDTTQQLMNYLEQSNILQKEQTNAITQELKCISSQFSLTDTTQQLMNYLEQSAALQKEQISVLTQELQSISRQLNTLSHTDPNKQRFLKLNHQGQSLPLGSENWDAVFDQQYGLYWEHKTKDDSVRDRKCYYEYVDDSPTDILMFQEERKINNQIQYITFINQMSLAGFSNWRLPTIEELNSLIHLESKQVDRNFFAHVKDSFYLTAEPGVLFSFSHGRRTTCNYGKIFLVSSGK